MQMTTRQLQAQQTKESIYNAAIKLFELRGYENVLIEDITNEANCAKGTFYLYYKSKKDLMYETVNRYNEISDRAYEEVKEIEDFREKLIKYSMYYYEGVRRTGRQILRALDGNNVLDGATDVVNSDDRSIYRVLDKLVEEGMEQGYLSRQYETAHYRRALITTFLGVDYYWCTRDEVDVVELITQQIGYVLDGLMKAFEH